MPRPAQADAVASRGSVVDGTERAAAVLKLRAVVTDMLRGLTPTARKHPLARGSDSVRGRLDQLTRLGVILVKLK